MGAHGDGQADSPSQGQGSTQRGTPTSTTAHLSPATQNARSSSGVDDGNEDGSEMLFARMADPYDSTADRNEQPDYETSTPYLGEAFSLTFVVKAVCSPSGDISSAPKVHYPIPPSPNDHDVTNTAENPAGLDPDTVAFLRARGALTLPQKEKDIWHWLGCSISLAQTLGMHRETTLATVGMQERYHVSYAISMSSLAVLMGRILALRFSPSSKPATEQLAKLGSDLEAWKAALPPDIMVKPMRQALDAPFGAANLQASYQHAAILLYRPTLIVPQSDIEEAWDRCATRAANVMTRIAEDLLTRHSA
ncbi:hypothetical protein CEP54_014313 [Fusarium duplospermum]|uniref:Uncharacterized protein n=1 Tax=Fusarium duplospermum TaxID=1325734 RepID=A0A428NX52_9HYPO|nr:hypothetical protein CEP54_014313 [Fusarium duplospermum]